MDAPGARRWRSRMGAGPRSGAAASPGHWTMTFQRRQRPASGLSRGSALSLVFVVAGLRPASAHVRMPRACDEDRAGNVLTSR